VLNGRTIQYRIVHSSNARKLRLRVGPAGVELIAPKTRRADDIEAFVEAHKNWLSTQLGRIESLRGIRRPQHYRAGNILFRGELTPVRVEKSAPHRGPNKVIHENACLTIRTGTRPQTPVVRTLENWLRREARRDIEKQLAVVTARVKKTPYNVYVMGQRTKWGNCSRLQTLSFNWRLVMAPEYVLRYLVTHEAVHLAILGSRKQVGGQISDADILALRLAYTSEVIEGINENICTGHHQRLEVRDDLVDFVIAEVTSERDCKFNWLNLNDAQFRFNVQYVIRRFGYWPPDEQAATSRSNDGVVAKQKFGVNLRQAGMGPKRRGSGIQPATGNTDLVPQPSTFAGAVHDNNSTTCRTNPSSRAEKLCHASQTC
jgi:predicted metal-dependent hydrolase